VVTRKPGRRRPGRAGAILLGLALVTACRDDPAIVTPPCGQAPELVPGSTVTAALGPGDPRRAGPYIHYYTLWPATALAVRIELVSAAFEPFLYLFDASGAVVDQGYGGEPGAGASAVAVERVLGAGCHAVGVSSWSADGTGSYLLSVEVAGPGGP
jgi:hypothetical protein